MLLSANILNLTL